MKKLFDLVVNKQLLKFGITGIISNLINLLFYSISFIFFGTNISVFIGYFTGLIFSYYSNKYWTFKFDKKMSTVQIQNDIIDDFKILDGDLEMTLNYLMELGESLNDLDEKYKIDDNLVKGCQSKVWLKCTKEDDKIYLEI